MGKPTKTIKEKLETKLSKLRKDENIKITKKQVKVNKHILFRYSTKEIAYTKTRYFPSLKEDIKEEDFTAVILLKHNTLKFISGNMCNPPRGVKKVIDMARHLSPKINKIIVGVEKNEIKGGVVYMTDDLYLTLVSINKEEGVDKVTRVRNRVAPFLKKHYKLESEEENTERDYSLMLQEIIATKKISQKDIAELTSELDGGEYNEVVIRKQINKQAEWLLNSIQTIVDEPDLPKPKAQELGDKFFNFPKTSISGPEDLMEKILTKYGQNIIFGVPALLNINKYVISSTGLPKSQFDILLINHLSDIEIVELKRPDEYLLEYDAKRNKFYICKTLAIATAQSERYISAILKDNDNEFKINGKTIREFIQSQVGDTIILSICRPRALIIIGTIQKIAKPYKDLNSGEKVGVSKKDYEKNLETAYKELKASFRNIEIITYSELLEGARLRLQIAKNN